MWVSGQDNQQLFLERNATPFGDGISYISGIYNVQEFKYLVGSVIADQTGILYADFSEDATNWDSSGNTTYTLANNQLGFKVPVLGTYCRFRFLNNSGAGQALFRFNMYGMKLG